MSRLYIIRHGERLDAVDEKWAESAELPDDPPLTEVGVQQAKTTGSWIKQQEEETQFVVISSPFRRCWQTAREIALMVGAEEVHLEPRICEFISTMYFDADPVLASLDCITEGLQPVRTKGEVGPLATFPESVPQMADRLKRFLFGLDWSSPRSVVLVTHGYGVSMMTEALDATTLVADTPYCCVTRCELVDADLCSWHITHVASGAPAHHRQESSNSAL